MSIAFIICILIINIVKFYIDSCKALCLSYYYYYAYNACLTCTISASWTHGDAAWL